MKKRNVEILIVICVLIAVTLTVSIVWLYDSFGHLSIDEIIFHFKVPMEGTNTDMVWVYMKECIWKILLVTSIISIILIYPMVKNLKVVRKINTAESKKTVDIVRGIAVSMLIISIFIVLITAEIFQYIKNQIVLSKFIENEYVAPESVNIQFPEEKRNLIYIFLESMETTYYSKKDGGLSEKDLIPEITKLTKDNLNFSDTTQLGGAYTLYGTTWTVGAMSAQTLGVPLKISIDQNALSEYSVFLGGSYGIGEVLEDNGYHNFLLVGSDAVFGGRKNLFQQHGNYEIWDLNSAMEEKKITEKVWWGYSDDNLFKFAKEKISKLAQEEGPFNFTILTVDTHFPDG